MRPQSITDAVIGLAERFEAENTFRGGGQRLRGEIGNGPHAAEPHVGCPGDQAGREHAIVRVLFDVSPQDVVKGVHKLAALVDEMQHPTDVDLAERIKQGVVHRLTAAGILEGPTDLPAMVLDLDMGIVPGSNPLIHLGKTAFQLLFERGELFLDRLLEKWELRIGDPRVLRLPLLIVQQIVLNTAQANALPTEDIPGLQPSPEEHIDQTLLAVGVEAFLASRLLGIEVAFHLGRDAAKRKGRGGLLAEDSPFVKRRLQTMESLQKGSVGRGGGDIDCQEDGP